MFIFKKVVAALLLPPGVFVVLLALVGLLMLRARHWRGGLATLLIALVIWGASILPVSHVLMQRLESGLTLPGKVTGDVIVLLGAGTHYRAADMSGEGFPSGDMLARMATAFRLQRRLRLPILITSGSVYAGQAAGSTVIKRLFLDWGVGPKDLIVETRSRDTAENARYSAVICEAKGFKKPILVTSAYHLKRAELMFNRAGLAVTLYPAYLSTAHPRPFRWHDFLPNHIYFSETVAALHEYLGLAYYRLVWW